MGSRRISCLYVDWHGVCTSNWYKGFSERVWRWVIDDSKSRVAFIDCPELGISNYTGFPSSPSHLLQCDFHKP